MKKISKLDILFWVLIDGTGIGFYLHRGSEQWKTFFFISIGFYLVVLFLVRALKIKIYRLDIIFWVLIAGTGIGFYLHRDSEQWKNFFFISIIFYLAASFYVRALYLQSIKENQRVTQLSDIKKKQFDTTTWYSARGVIIYFNPLGKVMDNGREAGRLFSFMIQIEGDDGSRWRTLIRDNVIPESHLKSFGKYTELMVLYNPENKYEAVFENEDWHHEVKK